MLMLAHKEKWFSITRETILYLSNFLSASVRLQIALSMMPMPTTLTEKYLSKAQPSSPSLVYDIGGEEEI